MSTVGFADLPLHDGSVSDWLLKIMVRLATAILRIMVDEFGPDKVVERFSNPLWFQAFNNIIGMDWDSSGSTTVTTGVLKTITWKNPDLGFLVLGGKGSRSRMIPEEAPIAVEKLGVDKISSNELIKVSRLVARIDSYLLQDGYSLYHHAVFLSRNGLWSIVQQGMNTETRMARRYHWLATRNFYVKPHTAVSGVKHEYVLNLVDYNTDNVRKTILDLVREKPSRIVEEYSEIYRVVAKQRDLRGYFTETKTGVVLSGVNERIVIYKPLPLPNKILSKLREIHVMQPINFDELMLAKGLNADLIRALVLISDLIYNEPPSTRDPVDTPLDPFKYAYAIGGKDGIPYPVNRKHAEEVVYTLEDIINRAKLGDREKLLAFRNLSRIKLRIITKYLT